MNIYLISQSEAGGYDTYDSAVVAAESEDDAKKVHPAEDCSPPNSNPWKDFGVWCKTPESVKVELLGKAKPGTERGVILASFNAG